MAMMPFVMFLADWQEISEAWQYSSVTEWRKGSFILKPIIYPHIFHLWKQQYGDTEKAKTPREEQFVNWKMYVIPSMWPAVCLRFVPFAPRSLREWLPAHPPGLYALRTAVHRPIESISFHLPPELSLGTICQCTNTIIRSLNCYWHYDHSVFLLLGTTSSIRLCVFTNVHGKLMANKVLLVKCEHICLYLQTSASDVSFNFPVSLDGYRSHISLMQASLIMPSPQRALSWRRQPMPSTQSRRLSS